MLTEYYGNTAARNDELRQADWAKLQATPGWSPADAIARLRDRIASLEGDWSPGGRVQRWQFKSNLEWILRRLEEEEVTE